MSSKSALLRTCSLAVNVVTRACHAEAPLDRARRRDHLLLVRDGETLSSLGATALQYLPAILGRHADQEAMPLRAAARVWLKRSLTLLRSSHFSPPPSRQSRS